MHPITPLKKLPPEQGLVETIKTLRQANKAISALKGIAKTIPNQEMLINAIVLQEAKESSEVENIITTQDELYKALTVKSSMTPQAKEGFDAVKFARERKDKLSAKLAKMTKEEIVAYFKKVRLESRIKPST